MEGGPSLKPDEDMAFSDTRPEIRVLMANPRGFCAGVVRAIDAVRDALKVHGAPVYVRRAIVHNREVVRELESDGAVFVEELDEVPDGSVVIFSAHGVSPAIGADARRRGLVAHDAVCPLVAKVHREVERHGARGRTVILIGHRGHPEIVGTLGHLDAGTAHVVNSVSEVERLPLRSDAPAAYAIQTTYSVEDAEDIVAALHRRFTNLVGPASSDICYATTNRQAAVRDLSKLCHSVLVVGEQFSSNASRPAEVARDHCPSVQLVANGEEIDWQGIPMDGPIGVTAAASTPESSVENVLDAIRARFRVHIAQLGENRESTVFRRLAVG